MVVEKQVDEIDADANKKVNGETSKEPDQEKGKATGAQTKKPEVVVKDPSVPKSSTKKSSRFYSASYFSSGDEAQFSPSTVYTVVKEQLVKVVVGMALLLAGYVPVLALPGPPGQIS